ncbi:MFS transporter [Parahaliea maris]|uniref:MFS transporter n=1 Tax=Parahaliea maris TaxID=2716870 RepID=A0A5C9A758_9GAMM|nr:MFS transporter [Parahaliea maris]TXS95842.1 MFS transporter [Parahaliea maris]
MHYQARTGWLQVPAVFRGWGIVASLFVSEMFAVGCTAYAFGLYVVPASEELGLSRASANSGLILLMVGMGVASPILGKLLDRFPARNVIVIGAMMLGAGFAVIALSETLWLLAVSLFLLAGPGAAAIGPLTASTVISRWFTLHRGKALGVGAAGTSLGGAMLVPLIALSLDYLTWRETLLLQGGVITLLVSFIAWRTVVSRPQDIGLHPDGADAPARVDHCAQADMKRWSPRELLRSRDFWCLSVAVSITFGVSQAILVSLVPYASDMDISPQKASFLVSVSAFSSIIGKLAVGALSDHMNKKILMFVIISFVFIKLGALYVQPDYMVLLMVLVVSGIALGGELPVWAALVAERFGAASYGTTMGLMTLINTVVNIAALRFIGDVYDRTGGYDLAFQVFALTIVVALVATACMTKVRKA